LIFPAGAAATGALGFVASALAAFLACLFETAGLDEVCFDPVFGIAFVCPSGMAKRIYMEKRLETRLRNQINLPLGFLGTWRHLLECMVGPLGSNRVVAIG